jgi:predicted RNA methylase
MDQNVSGSDLALLYNTRFNSEEMRAKRELWQVLCERFLQRYVRPTDTVPDLGAGSCEFLNTIQAARKIAVDLNPETKHYAANAEVLLTTSEDLSTIGDGTVDVVFASNSSITTRSNTTRITTALSRIVTSTLLMSS